MYSSYEDLVNKEKYIKVNEFGELVIDYPEKLKIIDFHSHLSNLFPYKQNNPTNKGTRVRYLTVPPIEALDLKEPYWTNLDYLIKKYSGIASTMRFSVEGIKIFNDMIKGGTFDNLFISQQNNMIHKSVILPISTVKSDMSMNAINAAKQYPDKLIPFCSVHPLDPELSKKIYQYKALGAKGLKLKITDIEMKGKFNAIIDLLKICHEANLPVLFHTGTVLKEEGKNISGMMKKMLNSTRVELYGELLEKLPKDLIFIFGHSGIQEYKLVAKYMKDYPSTYAEVSSQSEGSIKYLIDQIGSERILFGTDWPALPQAITLSRVLLATEGDRQARDNILYKNAEKLLL